MEKLVYLLHRGASVSGSKMRDHLILKVAPELRAAGATQISVNVADEDVAAGEKVVISRSDPPIRAMVSFWMQNADDREPCLASAVFASRRHENDPIRQHPSH